MFSTRLIRYADIYAYKKMLRHLTIVRYIRTWVKNASKIRDLMPRNSILRWRMRLEDHERAIRWRVLRSKSENLWTKGDFVERLSFPQRIRVPIHVERTIRVSLVRKTWLRNLSLIRPPICRFKYQLDYLFLLRVIFL